MKKSLMKTMFMAIVLTIVVLVSPSISKADMISEAVPMNLNEQVMGTLTRGQTDYYQFTTGSQLSSFTFDATGLDRTTRFEILNAGYIQQAKCSAASGKTSEVTVKLNPNETYYVKVYTNYLPKDKTASYVCTISEQPDEPDTMETAQQIDMNASVQGTCIVESQDEDWFQFTTGEKPVSCKLEATTITRSRSLKFHLKDATGKDLGRFIAGNKGGEKVVKLEANKTYYVQVEKSSVKEVCEYSFQTTCTEDEPDTMDTAEVIELDGVKEGNICDGTDVDWYAFDVDQTSNYTFTAVGIQRSIKLEIVDKNQKNLKKFYGGSNGDSRSIVLTGKTRYYLRITGSTYTDYTFGASIEPIDINTPKVTSVYSNSRKVCINVSYEDVDGYEIQYATNVNMKNAKLKRGSQTNYTISGLKKNTKYYVRVRAYKKVNGEKIFSEWSKVKSAKVKK